MKKLKHETELFKAGLFAAMKYAQESGAVEFEPTDSASQKQPQGEANHQQHQHRPLLATDSDHSQWQGRQHFERGDEFRQQAVKERIESRARRSPPPSAAAGERVPPELGAPSTAMGRSPRAPS